MMIRPISQAAAALALAGTLGLAQAQEAPDDSLFKALGGLPVIEQVVQDFMDIMLADARIRHTFDHSNIQRVKDKLVEQFCQISGGGCTYTGDPMKEVHQGLKLSNADFNALVEDLQAAMDQHDIATRTQNRLLALLAPMQRDTVTR
ncbi:cyanoglobin [Herbaspirillum rubrisubalbicans]|uniref:Group 1 truncated hemoglobin n=2 Tax=Herbaspirillum rubrisubalbicans TaxID=80842 RepID=A0ABX9BZM2_9BURK|nr:group 1 truncated hemoglobin [Herbaspirillum rubrisubalbicans]NQE47445.1 cyanoglobin [Herbaspirillum rubrisubalbicans]QJQ01649.1 group 1 truncated hemoglobin [Herbaspirillum rubrisubalbicans Os34]RAM63421.1 cyanoglobin [Herbaspirillum rubrisubalbicans]RAN48349.1 cyanoglobin [Herbaspirillum rubrisubalbicans]